jgi:hypothetical protein
MLGYIFNIVRILIYFTLFILLIPDLFFTIPPSGSKIMVTSVHGLIYAGVFVLLDIIFNSKRIFLCIKSLGTAVV